MAATSKDELLALTHKEFAKLQQALEKVEADFAVVKDADDTSIKDIVGHRTNWIHLFFGWYEDGRAGREVFFPAKGYKWNDLKRYNAIIRAQQANLGWAEAAGPSHFRSATKYIRA